VTNDAGDYYIKVTGRTVDEGSSPDGFLFQRSQMVRIGVFLEVSNPGASQPHLTWNTLNGVDHYDVYRGDQLIGTSTTGGYTDTLLTAPGDYFYHVIPVLSDGSTYDVSTLAEAIITTLLTSPTGLTAPTPTNNAPVLTWDAEPNAASYQVFRQDVNTGDVVLAGTSVTNNFTDVYAPGIYNYTVKAVDSEGNVSDQSAPFQIVVVNTSTPNRRNLIAQGQTEVTPIAGTDMLPGLGANNNTKATFDFSIGYVSGGLTVKRPLTVTYKASGHTFFAQSTSSDWLVINGVNNSHGTFQGMADVTVDGVTRNLPYVVVATDGALSSPTTPDNFQFTVYADNTRTTTLYSLHENLIKGKIKIN
jgi:hypothetical protein